MLVVDVVIERAGEFDVGIERRLVGLGGGRQREVDGLAESQRAGAGGELVEHEGLTSGRVLPLETRILDVDAAQDQRRYRCAAAFLVIAVAGRGGLGEIFPVAAALGVARKIDAHTVQHDGVHFDTLFEQRQRRDRHLDFAGAEHGITAKARRIAELQRPGFQAQLGP